MEEEYLAEDPVFETAESPYAGGELLSWTVDEYVRHERGMLWYAIAIIVALGVLMYAVVTQNFLFAVIIIMFAIIMGLSSLREPRKFFFVITDLGVGIGDKFFPYKEFRNFWLLYEPPEVKNVYLEFKRAAWPHLVIPLDEQDPLEVRKTLLRFMREDLSRDEEPFGDLLARIFKI